MLLAHAEPVAFFEDGLAAPFFYGDGLAAPCGHVWTPSLLVMLLQRAPALRSLAVDGCPTLATGARCGARAAPVIMFLGLGFVIAPQKLASGLLPPQRVLLQACMHPLPGPPVNPQVSHWRGMLQCNFDMQLLGQRLTVALPLWLAICRVFAWGGGG